MTEVITIGLDLAKNVFQIHGVDGLGKVASTPIKQGGSFSKKGII